MFSVKNWRDGQAWKNWSENYLSFPSFYSPTTVEEVMEIVQKHAKERKTIRITGAAHSFSPVAMPEMSAMSLHHLRGLISVDLKAMEATFYAGTYLYEIGPLLEQYGLALINMGDINVQSLAGVISTGTHGTGIKLGSFSSMVTKWGFVNGTGEYIEHSRGANPLSEALHVSLGLLGVLVTVTIKVIPIYSLQYESTSQNINTALLTFQRDIRANRHLEWYYFPGSETIQVKKMNNVDSQKASSIQRSIEGMKLQVVENGLFYMASKLCQWRPSMSSTVSKISSKLVSQGERTDIYYNIFPSPRHVKFVEMEYAIPLKYFESCMEEIHHAFKSEKFQVHFPIECRTTAGESGYLSPTQGEESAFIAFHMFKGMDETAYFNWARSLMRKCNGRPHWGKMNDYCAETIESYYPKNKQFNFIRMQHDPHNIFMTSYFSKIFP
ncbi:D-arabinono-1,4-lactone oxidase [Lysinibacillus sp. 54212]|uniref:D-arabinono-1,4-lactone oxidase n=1 Tax=Lysinibacillus sp. 54212 TaxID=3119829 RepID=UPI002FCB1092